MSSIKVCTAGLTDLKVRPATLYDFLNHHLYFLTIIFDLKRESGLYIFMTELSALTSFTGIL